MNLMESGSIYLHLDLKTKKGDGMAEDGRKKRTRARSWVAVVMALLLFPLTASATLYDVADTMFYDDVSGLVWYEDLAAFNALYPNPISGYYNVYQMDSETYDINGDGTSDALAWRLATYWEVQGLISGSDGYDTSFLTTESTNFSIYGKTMFPYEFHGYTFSSLANLNDGLERAADATEARAIDYPDFVGDSAADYAIVADVTFGTAPVTDPVPEPATLVLMGAGMLGAVGFRKKKTKAN